MKFKKKNNLSVKGRTVAAIIAFFIILLCVTAYSVPAPQLKFVKKVAYTDDLTKRVEQGDIFAYNGCELSADGNVKITGDDAHIIFSGYNTPIQTVKLNFKKPSELRFFATLYYDGGENFDEAKTNLCYVEKGDLYVCFELPKSENNSLRIDIDNDYSIESIELHTKAPQTVYTPIKFSPWRYVLAFLISGCLTVVFVLFDKYIYPISEKIKNWYLKNYRNILINTLVIFLVLAVSVGIELLLAYLFFGVSSTGLYFNLYRYFFIVCILLSIYFIVKYLKKNISSDKLFAILMFFVGVSMILCSPFGHICWDYDSHSSFVFEKTYIGDGYVTDADLKIFSNEEIKYPRENALDNLNNTELLNEAGKNVIGVRSKGFTTIAHFPAGFAVAVTRFMGFPYTVSNTFGRLANLLVYICISYFALKKLTSGKAILATIAFFPTSMYLATNYSYDFWVTAFIFLGVSYFLSEIKQQDKEVTVLNTVIMNAAFILACIPKQIYMPIMLLPFFMRKNWKNKSQRKRYYLICIAMTVFMLALLLIKSVTSISGGGDKRGGADVNSMAQVSFILSEPLRYAKILLTFLKNYLSIGQMKRYINLFAYLGFGVTDWLFRFMIAFTTLTDKERDDKFNKYNLLRIVSILLFFGIICLVATSMYVAFTAVGSDTIMGCQSRYITPMLFPLLVFIANPGIRLKIKKEVYYKLSYIVLSSAVFIEVGNSLLSKLM